jgi:hypothetical protein
MARQLLRGDIEENGNDDIKSMERNYRKNILNSLAYFDLLYKYSRAPLLDKYV